MRSTKHQTLYRLPEFRALNPKRQKLLAAHLLEDVSLARGCDMLALNLSRESRNPGVVDCLKAFNLSQDPDGQGQVEEHVRRLEECVYGLKSEPDANFAGQVFELNPRSFLSKELGIRDL